MLAYLGYAKKRSSYKKLVNAAFSMELLHDFLLIHDDVIDNADLRRGKLSLHRSFNKKFNAPLSDPLGPNLSIVAGDIIFALSINALLEMEGDAVLKEKAVKIFVKTAAATGIGEYIDVVNNRRKIDSVREKEIMHMYTMKTAKYTFAAPLLIGAALAGAGEKELKKLSRLGVCLGQAFQIQDDLLDVFSTTEKIGKPILSDLNEGKKTLLIWKTYRRAAAADKKRIKLILSKNKKTYNDLVEIRKLIKRYGADRYCLDIVSSLIREVGVICRGLKMRNEYRDALLEFVRSF